MCFCWFDAQFLRVETLTEDGGVVKKVIKEGSGDLPKKGYKIIGNGGVLL